MVRTGRHFITDILPFMKCKGSSVFPDGLWFVAEFGRWTQKRNDRATPGQGRWALSECSSRKVCLLSACSILESHQHCSTLPLALVLKSSAAMTYRSQLDFEGFGSPKSSALGFGIGLREQETQKLGKWLPQQVSLELSALSWAQGAAARQEEPDSETI